MTYPTVFANLSSGVHPASLIDDMFNIGGQQGNIPGTVSGTNAITFTPGTNYYLPTAYTNGQIVSFKAVATSTGSVTFQIGGLGFIKLFTAAGVQAGSGDVTINVHYAVQYWSDLDTGSGGFIILNASVTSVANPVQGSFKNLAVAANSNSTVVVTADACVVQNVGGGTARLTSVSLNISTSTSGANGIDSGSVGGPLWYSVYVIYNASSTTVAGLLSTNTTSPTLPSGYTYFARCGFVRTDANPFLYRTTQFNGEGQYLMTAGSTNTQNSIIIASGTAGSYSSTTPTLAAVTVVGAGNTVAPPICSAIHVCATSVWKGGTTANVLVAPNTSFGGTNNGPTGSNGNIFPIWVVATGQNNSNWVSVNSSQIAWASDNSGGAISILGWKDNL